MQWNLHYYQNSSFHERQIQKDLSYALTLSNPSLVLSFSSRPFPLQFSDHKHFGRNKLITLSFVQDSIPNLSAMSIKTEQLQLVLCGTLCRAQQAHTTLAGLAANGNKCVVSLLQSD